VRLWDRLNVSLESRWRVVIAIIGLILFVVLVIATAAGAATISVPLNTVVRGNEGDIKPVRDPVSVSDFNAQAGWICDVEAVTGNPGSEHPSNDLIVGSNGDEVRASNVEEFSGKVTQAAGTLILGSTVTFDVELGPDGVFSGGMDVEFKCSPPDEEEVPPSTTTTITSTPTTTTSPPSTTTTTAPTTTTTEPLITTSTSVPTSSFTTTSVSPDESTTTEVPPPTLIESGDAGYFDEVEEGEEHQDEGFDWLFFGMSAVIAGFAGGLTYLAAKRYRDK